MQRLLQKRVVRRRLSTFGILTFGLSLGLLLLHRPLLANAVAGACTQNAAAYGSVTNLSITTDASVGTDTVWTRMAVPDSTNNSYALEIDDANDTALSCYTISNTNGGAIYTTAQDAAATYFNNDTTNWVSTPVSLAASTTYHLKLIGTASGVVVDRLLFPKIGSCTTGATDGTAQPTGTGDNCALPPDTVPPVGSITNPASGAVANPTITLSASDNIAVKTIDVYDGTSKLGTATLTSGSSQSGIWSYTWNTTALAAGSSHNLTAKIDDGTNITTTAAVTVTIADTSPPTAVTIASPTNNLTVAGTITLAGTAVDNVTPTSFSFAIKQGSTTVKTVVATAAGCSANITCSASNTLNTTSLADGSYSLVATAKDAAGNVSTASTPVTFMVKNASPPSDTTPPIISSVSLAAGSVLSSDLTSTSNINLPFNSASYKVAVVANDNSGGSGLKQVSVQVDGGPAQVQATGFNYALAISNLAMDGPAATCVNQAPHVLTVTATDNANKSTTSNINFYVTKSADMNDDCHVDYHDLSMLAGKYAAPNNTGSSIGRVDTNKDGIVDYHDLSALAGQYGKF